MMITNLIKYIDTTFDFTSDTPHYWDNFWQNCDGLGCGSADPDSKSPTLRMYHKILWSKRLPNGEFLDLQKGENSNDYLIWKDFNFGSDSIINVYKAVCDLPSPGSPYTSPIFGIFLGLFCRFSTSPIKFFTF